MEKFFFYGTLAHLPLLEIVLGRKCAASDITIAELPNFQAFWVKDQAHPFLERCLNGNATGLVVSGLSGDDLARLAYYEAGFIYDIEDRTVVSQTGNVKAKVFFATLTPDKGAPWRLEDWIDKHAALTELSAREVMQYFGEISGEDLNNRFDAIRRRAASTLRGQSIVNKHEFISDMTRDDVKVDLQSIPYSNFFIMQEFDLQFSKYDGNLSEKVNRAAFTGFDVACVLPYDPVLDCVLVVEQFRLGPYARGEEKPWSIEPVCGHVDAGETPIEAAHRECAEEAGLLLNKLLEVAKAYPSPGASTEYFYSYVGLCDLSGVKEGINGVEGEAENIRSIIIPYTEFMDFIDTQASNNVILILLANWLARHRASIRG